MNALTRKRILWCLGVVCVFAAGLAVFVWLSPKLRVSRATFSLIQRKMTEPEVEGLLGGRGSKAVMQTAKGELAVEAWTDAGFQGSHDTLRIREWRTPDNCIKVGFDAHGKAVYAIITTSTADMTWWQKVRWWTGI